MQENQPDIEKCHKERRELLTANAKLKEEKQQLRQQQNRHQKAIQELERQIQAKDKEVNNNTVLFLNLGDKLKQLTGRSPVTEIR